ncbi:hypothetical protein L2E82_12189 [Cichorium intybus]|uniref:Uncharacterized protein n=1 Tax=Cichorium intybus TaxID=13427 RepID=A0ACB9GGL6_CICIN|nr:hypothetical protein L2E82_12189 [Cichorium intybus]
MWCVHRFHDMKSSIRKGSKILLKGYVIEGIVSTKKEYPIDLSLSDINNVMYSFDEFRMYTFKVKPRPRAYTHDWTECLFVHLDEKLRRSGFLEPGPELKSVGSWFDTTNVTLYCSISVSHEWVAEQNEPFDVTGGAAFR